MKRNTLNILYWTSTILFGGFMAFTAIPSLTGDKKSIEFMHDMLGYPLYFITFISVAKMLGAAAIIIPGVPSRLKEWAYAGLFFDIAGALYSVIAVNGKLSADIIFILLPALVGALSYYWWHKRKTAA